MFVQGGQRVGFYAIKDIPAQTELLFDYKYERLETDFSNWKT